jgi:hypothetical protein
VYALLEPYPTRLDSRSLRAYAERPYDWACAGPAVFPQRLGSV